MPDGVNQTLTIPMHKAPIKIHSEDSNCSSQTVRMSGYSVRKGAFQEIIQP